MSRLRRMQAESGTWPEAREMLLKARILRLSIHPSAHACTCVHACMFIERTSGGMLAVYPLYWEDS